jgi:hypothetical protein
MESVASNTSGFAPVARNLASIVIVPAASTQSPAPPLITLLAHSSELVVSMVPEYVTAPVGAAAKQIEMGAVP